MNFYVGAILSEVMPSGPLRGPLRKRESNLWEREKNDWYCEPTWCSARLFEEEAFEGNVIDPSCGGGNILKSAADAGLNGYGYDVVERSGFVERVQDFMSSDWACPYDVDNIVSNPPFGLCDSKAGHPGYVDLALQRARQKVALLLPSTWVNGDSRSRWLAATPLRKVLFITPRPSMPPGHVIAAGEKPGNGTKDFCWMIWLRGYDGRPEIGWLRRERGA